MNLDILYLTKNMETYQGANYQLDFINYLKKNNNLFFYGPGYSNYSSKYKLNDILSIFDNKPKIIFVGHSWLSDTEGKILDNNFKIDLSNTKLLKLFFLNKEYVNLEKKLEFCKKNNFNISLTHHHNNTKFSQITKSKFYFIPFAFDKHKFKMIDNNIEKKFDIGFSGIVQNANKNSNQSDIRRKITKKLFYSAMDIPFIKKNKNLDIFWNIIPQNNLYKKFARILRYYNYYNIDEYIKKICESKIYINTLSPYQLISPRYFETLAGGTVLFCEKNDLYKRIFNQDFEYFTFENNLSDFSSKINYILNNYTQLNNIIKKNKLKVYEKHSWENRVNNILSLINKI